MQVLTAANVAGDDAVERLNSPASALLTEMTYGYWLPRCLHAVAELGVADHIASSPVSSAKLAKGCGANEDALHRAMRALSSHNIFEQTADGFAHTALSLPLRSDHPQSVRAFARMIGMPAL